MEEKKKCELCGGVARMFCESDQASLCWDCDGKVHGANFLVAKHTRCLLCSACQSHTPWKASGLRLSPTVTICGSCIARKNNAGINHGGDCDGDRLGLEDDGAESYEDDEEDEGREEEEEKEEEEEAENQVVPAQQLPVTSSSSSVSSGDGEMTEKKKSRLVSDLNCSDEEESCESRPLKRLSSSSRLTVMMNGEGCGTSSSSSSTLVLKIEN